MDGGDCGQGLSGHRARRRPGGRRDARSVRSVIVALLVAVMLAVLTACELFLIVYALSPDDVGAGSESEAWLSGLVLTGALWWIAIRIYRGNKALPRTETLVLVLVCGVSMAFLTDGLIHLYGPTLSESEVATISIRGYSVLDTKTEVHDGEPETTRYYLGRPVLGPLSAVISGQGLTIESTPSSWGGGDFDVVGRGRTSNGCAADFLRLRDDTDPAHDMNITGDQRRVVMSGQLDVLGVDVLCGRG